MLHIKRYIVWAIVFLALIGGYIYFSDSQSVTLMILGVPIVLPLAVWMVTPALLLLLFTLFHLWYYGAKIYFSHRRIEKDFEEIVQKVASKITGGEFRGRLKNREFVAIAKILDRFILTPDKDSAKSENKKIDDLFEEMDRIDSGEYVDSKALSFKEGSEFFIKNQQNRVKSDSKFLNEVLKKSAPSDPLFTYAMEFAIEQGLEKEVKTYWNKLDKGALKSAFLILDRFFSGEKKIFSQEELNSFMLHFDFSADEYIKCAKVLKKVLNPDEILKLFENLASKKESAEDGYLFVLFDLEMIEEAALRIESASSANIERFKTYLLLKKEGKHIGLDIFF